ncbi:hypothetical protein Tco_0459795 [Tanacetum coccineum]
MKSQESTNAFVKESFMDLKTQLEIVVKNHQASIQNLENKFDRLADKQSGRPSGSLPSNTQPNPKGHNSKAYQPPQSRNKHVNVIFTRSDKSYNPTVNPNDQQNDSETPINFDSDDEDEEPKPQPKTQNPKPVKETPLPKPYKPKILYPQRLRKENMEAQYEKFFDMIRVIRINVPLINDCDNHDLSRLDNQSIERDRLIGIGFVLNFMKFISFTFGDKEMISVIEAIIREVFVKLLLDSFRKLSIRLVAADGKVPFIYSFAIHWIPVGIVVAILNCSEANGIIPDPKLELENSHFTFDLVPLSYESVDVFVGENWLLRHKAGWNQMGNEPILALPEGAYDFVVYYDARSKDLEACLEKGEGDCLYVATNEGSYEGLHG